jgi:hypothetical protein
LIIVIVVEAALVLVAAIWWLWWRLPRRQVRRLDIQIHDPKDRADTEDNFRKTVGQALGGAAVLIGAVVAYLQFTQQQKASDDLLISNQVSKGFEQLAGKEIAMRLGGIYALEAVMNTSEQYHKPVLEALCAFVLDHTRNKPAEVKAGDKTVNDKPKIQPLATDIQAALTVIGRRSVGIEIVDLSGANLSGADLIDANLSLAHLIDANLSLAHLIDANLSLAHLIDANLSGASLSGANLWLANLSGANLSHANLSHANLIDANLSGAHLIDASLSGADLSGADLSDAHALTQPQLDQACGKPKALPVGLHLDKPCP